MLVTSCSVWSARSVLLTKPTRHGSIRRCHSRPIDGENGAGAEFAVDTNVAAALIDDAADDSEAQSGTQARGFGSEEGFVKVGQGVSGHARAGVAHAEDDVVAGRKLPRIGGVMGDGGIGGFENQGAAARPGVSGVDGQGDGDLIELSGGDMDGSELGGEGRARINVGARPPNRAC